MEEKVTELSNEFKELKTAVTELDANAETMKKRIDEQDKTREKADFNLRY